MIERDGIFTHRHQNAVNPIVDKSLHISNFTLGILVSLAYHHIITLPIRHIIYPANYRTEEVMHNFGDNHSYGVGFTFAQTKRQSIGPIINALGKTLYKLLSFRTDIGMILQRS